MLCPLWMCHFVETQEFVSLRRLFQLFVSRSVKRHLIRTLNQTSPARSHCPFTLLSLLSALKVTISRQIKLFCLQFLGARAIVIQ